MSRKLNIQDDFKQILQLQKEGQVITNYIAFNNTAGTTTAGTQITAGTYTVPAGMCLYIESIAYSSDGPCMVTGPIKEYPNATSQTLTTIFGTNGGLQQIPMRRFLYEGGSIQQIINATTTTKPTIYIQLHGILFTNDQNFKADKKMVFLGDSLMLASSGTHPTNGTVNHGRNMYPTMIKELLLNAGKKASLINRGISGTTTTSLTDQIDAGVLDGLEYDLMVVGYGMNDSSATAVSVANYTNNLKKAIYHRNKFRPTASIIFVAPNNTDVSNRSTIGDYRTAMQGVANDATIGGSSRKVYYYDASTAFSLNATATADTNFASNERTAGNRTHPSVDGNILISNGLFSVVQTTDFYTN